VAKNPYFYEIENKVKKSPAENKALGERRKG